MQLLRIFTLIVVLLSPINVKANEAKSWLKKEIDIIISAYQNLNLPNENKFLMIEQTINNILEQGKCTIEYPKKIYCLYNNKKKKIMVSNGKTLVITNQQKSSYYLYPLNKTPLELILDKDFLIEEIKNLEGRNVDNKYYNFTILNNNNKINIFFNNKNYNLIGWQTEDIYQNLVITYIYNLVKNSKIDEKLFILPKTH